MKTLQLTQNTPEWLAFRQNHFNASEAPIMLGISPYQKRDDLLKEKAFGITKEYTEYQQKIFENGHKFENFYRNSLAEQIVGDDLYPAVGLSEEYQNLAASFDGITLLNDIIFEHKTLNSKLENVDSIDNLPEHYKAQMEQQLLVSGAKKCLFAASKYDQNNELIKEVHFWYESDPNLREKIIIGWEQFAKDLQQLKVNNLNDFHEKSQIISTNTILDLPVIDLNIIGRVVNSNLTEYKQAAVDIFKNIKTDLQSDDDFANAENDLKFCKKIETQIKDAKQKALQQQHDVATLFNMLDEIANEARTKRLQLEKLTKNRKDEIKAEIISSANKELNEFIYELNKNTTPFIIDFDYINVNLIKGLKTLSSIKDKVATEVANLKVDFKLKHKDLLEKRLYFKQIADDFTDEFANEFLQLSQMDFDSFKRYVDARVENIKTIKNSPANLLKVALQNANENKSNIENKINAYVENLVDAFLKNNITENAESVRNLLIKFYFFINR